MGAALGGGAGAWGRRSGEELRCGGRGGGRSSGGRRRLEEEGGAALDEGGEKAVRMDGVGGKVEAEAPRQERAEGGGVAGAAA